jgi:hypothetical protein
VGILKKIQGLYLEIIDISIIYNHIISHNSAIQRCVGLICAVEVKPSYAVTRDEERRSPRSLFLLSFIHGHDELNYHL